MLNRTLSETVRTGKMPANLLWIPTPRPRPPTPTPRSLPSRPSPGYIIRIEANCAGNHNASYSLTVN